MRILGIDYGSKRIGLAISDETGTVALPLEYLEAGSYDAVCREIVRIATERGAGRIVVGVPVRMDTTSSPQTESTLEFLAALRRTTTLPVDRWDERLTSVQAERALLEGNVSRRKRKEHIDKLAAQLMLQSYLDARNVGEGSGEERGGGVMG